MRVKMDNLTFIPMASNNMLKIGSNTTSNNGHDYWTTVVIDNVTYIGDEDDVFNAFTFTGNDGTEYKVNKIPRNANVKVNCSCLDFYYRFAVWDDRHKALDGSPPPPYIRKTQTRPEVNPMHSPGMCKHVISLMGNLRTQGLFI